MEDSINNLGLVTTDKDVNDLAARHCEDAQVCLLFVYPPSNCILLCRHSFGSSHIPPLPLPSPPPSVGEECVTHDKPKECLHRKLH